MMGTRASYGKAMAMDIMQEAWGADGPAVGSL